MEYLHYLVSVIGKDFQGAYPAKSVWCETIDGKKAKITICGVGEDVVLEVTSHTDIWMMTDSGTTVAHYELLK